MQAIFNNTDVLACAAFTAFWEFFQFYVNILNSNDFFL